MFILHNPLTDSENLVNISWEHDEKQIHLWVLYTQLFSSHEFTVSSLSIGVKGLCYDAKGTTAGHWRAAEPSAWAHMKLAKQDN